MIVSRTPLRITLGGGGSDDPAFVSEHGGFAITAAISKYIHITVNESFGDGYLLRYSKTEHVQNIKDIEHPILREALKLYDVWPHVEIVSVADVPSGTGLGSSGAFTVGLCNALAVYTGVHMTQQELANQAAMIELDILERAGGQQDHWATALGDVRVLEFGDNGRVTTRLVSTDTLALQDHLSLFFTGYHRDSDAILRTQTDDALSAIKTMGKDADPLLYMGNIEAFGQLMNDHWQMKRKRSPEMSNDDIDNCYNVALQNGAIGGKLVGAGGGGFLLFVTNDRKRLSMAMYRLGLRELEFSFDHEGTTVICD